MNWKVRLRHKLHKFPELSGMEYNTSKIIKEHLAEFSMGEIVEFGETGFAFVIKGRKEGKRLMFRTELDALPINEINESDHCSVHPGVAHLCGHDGHIVILLGLIDKIMVDPPAAGEVVFLFQPAEETGEGAEELLMHPDFKNIKPHWIYALHNIPGYKKGVVVSGAGCFSSASRGMTIKLKGMTSHAAEPEKGISPVKAIAHIIELVNKTLNNQEMFRNPVLLTVVHVLAGEIAFGTSPGYAELRMTLRSSDNSDMENLVLVMERSIENIAVNERLAVEFSYSENFPSIDNSETCVQKIEEAAEVNGLKYVRLEKPFSWSEDFGHFTGITAGGFFGIGAGENCSALHNPDYDFPDDIIDTGVEMFYGIYKLTELS